VTLPEDLVGPPRRVVELVASRARIVAAADETRRRLHRDLHDGAQQRLVHAVIALKLARDAVDPGSAAAALVEEALAHAERASRELREVVRTVLPGSLMYGGLRTGLESLVADVAVPAELRISAPRLPAAVETTAYLVVAEALTNAVRHSSAQRVEVEVRFSDETLVVEVSDDGTGGADAAGAGLTGLRDRVDTAGGSLTISSPPGTGTTVRARLPAQPREDAATQP
jgi:signal transduction histidine kinase